MPLLRPLFATLFLGLCLAANPVAAAEPPAAKAVQDSLAALADRKLPEAEQSEIKAQLEQTLSFLAARAESQEKLDALKTQLRDAPRLTSEAQRELARLKAGQPVNVASRYARSSVEQLEQQLSERSSKLSGWQQELAEASSLLITAQTRPERAQAEISANQTRAMQINNLLKVGKEAGKPLTAERRSELNAELAALEAQTALRRQELAGNNLLQDLGSARHELLQERIRRLDQESLDLQALISDKRRVSSEKTVAELSREAEKATPDSLLAQESATNLKISDYLLRATERLNQLTRMNLETKQQLDSVSQAAQALDEQVSVLKGSLLLAKILYQQKQALPKPQLDRNLADEIADIRLYQFELNQQRDKLGDLNAYVDGLLASQPSEQVTPELRKTLLELATTRNDLLQHMNRELNTLLNESITLQLNQKQLQEMIGTLRATLDEQMFWIPSNKPLDLAWLQQMPHLLERQLKTMPWGSGVRELGAGLVDRPWLFIPLLLLIGGLLWRRSWLYAKLQALHEDIGHYKRDSQMHTPMAIFLNVLLALPVTLFLTLCGVALLIDARGQNATLGSALLDMAQAWLVFYTLYRILSPGGVAELHFRWPRPQVALLSKQVRRLGLVVMALVAVVTVAEHQPQALADDVVGILVVLTGYALMTLILSKLLLAEPMREQTSPFRLLLGIGVSVLPLAFIVAVGFGYYYTSLKLTDRLINTLYLLILALLIEAAFVRGLAVAARRLAYARVLAKRQTQTKENEEGDEVTVEEPVMDIDQINQQSLRLIRLALFGGFLACMYLVWADLISVFAYLDQITLYQYSAGTGATATQIPISLLDVLGALIIAGITAALARNLPGLLEVLVLSKLRLAQGSAYATTTLLSYAIAGIGFVTALSTLGVSWDKLQWLVAALSVGIGFGMQAIFANFISGLILLFERPIRIGDLVTIGTVTGTVNRIRIRATHITDSDRKEVIVPNQILLTSQLINWTLTDTITRIVLVYTVNRGADLELVRKLLLQAAQENSRVLRDPVPNVQLKTYGASTLEHELKVYVRELGDRGLATDELNRRIDQLFQEHDINIASTPKMDVVFSRKSTAHPASAEAEQAAEQQPPR
ncbi:MULTISPECIES: mechanosensitive channel MscK [unclassified Pseudomonas]|uniref:mechanosensitive channel MscK n=1 Tax=unclassified Pseudomonas TaxID=196821 RepID=UPI00244CC089|nr:MULTISPECIES: mechanosensitive channel MscK [unclassified Pseudomonas]MDG9925637.1 mechanosensitive channel MscK [Pseudomonas sp. GD04045]MDH0037574.1 mechanosensitive channel MscK [Pseudomonas sp. GD04019]